MAAAKPARMRLSETKPAIVRLAPIQAHQNDTSRTRRRPTAIPIKPKSTHRMPPQLPSLPLDTETLTMDPICSPSTANVSPPTDAPMAAATTALDAGSRGRISGNEGRAGNGEFGSEGTPDTGLVRYLRLLDGPFQTRPFPEPLSETPLSARQ
jgi:hypothetical protein